MYFKSKICHIENGKAIVNVTGWKQNFTIGSALGEGKDAEEAEDRAISRLMKRTSINNSVMDSPINKVDKDEDRYLDQPENEPVKYPQSVTEKGKSGPISEEPNDWSQELTEIDSNLKRLKWTRSDEKKLIKHIFGYENRNKITSFEQMKLLLQELKLVASNTDIDDLILSLKKENLISRSNKLLENLSWESEKGREYIKKNFNVISRNELNIEQLIIFNNTLNQIILDNS